MKNRLSRFLGALFLVAGTTIGGGVLAMPICTGQAGFFPSLLLMGAVWFFMLLTAFYLLEVNLRLKGEANLITMAQKTLGRPGEAIAWIFYLLLLYALLAAYLLGCGQILADVVSAAWSKDIPAWMGSSFIFAAFAFVVFFGTAAVDFWNRLLMIGLFVGYAGLVVMAAPHVKGSLLLQKNWLVLPASLSVITTSFGYHIIIPTLTTYLEHDQRLLAKTIFWGSLIPFVFYVVWQLLVLGILPIEGEGGICSSAALGLQATIPLQKLIQNPFLALFARLFAFCAILTSILGVSLSLRDFLADGLKIQKDFGGRLLLIFLTFVPPLVFALFFPNGFIKALHYAGVCVAVLLMLLPSLMAWCERYQRKKDRAWMKQQTFLVPGGKWALGLTIAFSCAILILEIMK